MAFREMLLQHREHKTKKRPIFYIAPHTGLKTGCVARNHVSKIPCGKSHENQFEANKTCLPFCRENAATACLPALTVCLFPHCSTSNNHCCDHFCKSTNNDGNLLRVYTFQKCKGKCVPHICIWHELFVINYISCKLLL